MTSSELQFEQTGVKRDDGPVPVGTDATISSRSNGLFNAARRILSIAPMSDAEHTRSQIFPTVTNVTLTN
jgi:hypothetical protein